MMGLICVPISILISSHSENHLSKISSCLHHWSVTFDFKQTTHCKVFFYSPFRFCCKRVYSQRTSDPNLSLGLELHASAPGNLCSDSWLLVECWFPKSHTFMEPSKVLTRYTNAKLNTIQTNNHVTRCHFMYECFSYLWQNINSEYHATRTLLVGGITEL